MHFVAPTLQAALAAWRQSPDPREQAKADNARFEEHASIVRLAGFEAESGDVTNPVALVISYIRYGRALIRFRGNAVHAAR